MPRRLIPLIAFALPFVAFALYRALRATGGEKRAWPLTVLFVAGAVLAAQTFVLAALTEPHRLARPADPPEQGPPLYKDHPQ